MGWLLLLLGIFYNLQYRTSDREFFDGFRSRIIASTFRTDNSNIRWYIRSCLRETSVFLGQERHSRCLCENSKFFWRTNIRWTIAAERLSHWYPFRKYFFSHNEIAAPELLCEAQKIMKLMLTPWNVSVYCRSQCEAVALRTEITVAKHYHSGKLLLQEAFSSSIIIT